MRDRIRRVTCGLAAALVAVAGLWLYLMQGAPKLATAVPDVPHGVQQSALRSLTDQGYQVLGQLGWSGARPTYQVSARYRLYFVATQGQGADLFSAEATVDARGAFGLTSNARRLTDTPAGEEGSLQLASRWLAYATRVGDWYQSVALADLGLPERLHVFVLGTPSPSLTLQWQAAAEEGTARLMVSVPASGGGAAWTIDPSSRALRPEDAGIVYVPSARGEFAWLPTIVSRVRELPGVGPEKIAFLENLLFALTDRVRQWTWRPAAHEAGTEQTLVQASPSPTLAATLATVATVDSTSPAPSFATPTATVQPTTSITVPERTVDPATTPVRTPTTLSAPSPSPTPSPTRAQPTTVGTPGPQPPLNQPLVEGIVRKALLKPDPQRPYAEVEVLEIDPGQLQLKMVPGTWEPRPTTGLVGAGVIPLEDWSSLVASFNGGFAAMHGYFGMMVDRKVYLPARDGVATIAVYEDGSLRMGTWGKDLHQTSDMVSYRQNCLPLVQNGVITAEVGKLALWGLSVSNEVYLYRSGLGVTADGRLIYVVGRSLSAYTLARALQMAGAQYAMQLDVDEYHVVFITYDVKSTQDGKAPLVTGRKLRQDMHGFDSFFLKPFQLDFFYLLRRPERLTRPVRLGTPIQAATAVAPHGLELPGHIAFASHRDGNWELYTMRASDPGAVRRLTQHPADDLYPAWSPDGKQLAYSTRQDGNAEICVLDVGTGTVRRVTQQPSEEWAPTWSPAGDLLAYQSDRNGQSDIYACALDGSAERRLTPMEGNHEAPHWSPDGRAVVFDSDLDVGEAVHASINLYVMGADGSSPHRLLAGGESPAWSPDGRTIAFTSQRTGRWQVLLCNSDGTGLRVLTNVPYDARYPTWSPDSRWIAYAGNAQGHWELYAISVQGGQPIRLTYGTSDSSHPAWGP